MMKSIATACIVLVCFSRTASADYFGEILETMMEAQGMDAQIIGRYVGVDPSSPLHFTFALDTTARSFSYQLDSGSTYEGNPIAVSGSGAFDASSGNYLWSSSGTAGSQSWTDSGVSHWTVLAVDDEEHDFMGKGMINGKTYDVTANCRVTGRSSSGNYQINVNGNVVLATGTDMLSQGMWTHSFKVGKGQDLPEGTMGTAKGNFLNLTTGDFQLRIEPVPEPSSLMLCGLGCIVIAATIHRPLKRKTP